MTPAVCLCGLRLPPGASACPRCGAAVVDELEGYVAVRRRVRRLYSLGALLAALIVALVLLLQRFDELRHCPPPARHGWVCSTR